MSLLSVKSDDMDYDLWCQFLKYTKPFHLNKLLSFQRNHVLTKTSTMQSVMLSERPRIIAIHFPEIRFPSRSSYMFWHIHRILVKTFQGSYLIGLVKLYKWRIVNLK